MAHILCPKKPSKAMLQVSYFQISNEFSPQSTILSSEQSSEREREPKMSSLMMMMGLIMCTHFSKGGLSLSAPNNPQVVLATTTKQRVDSLLNLLFFCLAQLLQSRKGSYVWSLNRNSELEALYENLQGL